MTVDDRLSDDAHRVLRSARWWARHLGAEAVDERHILIGVVSVDDPELRFQLHGLRLTTHAVVDAMGVVEDDEDELSADLPADDVAVPLAPAADDLLKVALGESLKLDHDDIRPAHLLLALLDRGADVIAAVLQRLHIDRATLAHEVRSLLTGGRGGPAVPTEHVESHLGLPRPVGTDRGPVRGWTSPRCHGCQNLLAEHAKLSTMLFETDDARERVPFRVLWCTACGTSFAIERIRPGEGDTLPPV